MSHRFLAASHDGSLQRTEAPAKRSADQVDIRLSKFAAAISPDTGHLALGLDALIAIQVLLQEPKRIQMRTGRFARCRM